MIADGRLMIADFEEHKPLHISPSKLKIWLLTRSFSAWFRVRFCLLSEYDQNLHASPVEKISSSKFQIFNLDGYINHQSAIINLQSAIFS